MNGLNVRQKSLEVAVENMARLERIKWRFTYCGLQAGFKIADRHFLQQGQTLSN